MVEVLFEKDKATLKFPKGWLAMDYMQKFLERLRIEAIIEKSKSTKEQGVALAEEIKKNMVEKIKKNF